MFSVHYWCEKGSLSLSSCQCHSSWRATVLALSTPPSLARMASAASPPAETPDEVTKTTLGFAPPPLVLTPEPPAPGDVSVSSDLRSTRDSTHRAWSTQSTCGLHCCGWPAFSAALFEVALIPSRAPEAASSHEPVQTVKTSSVSGFRASRSHSRSAGSCCHVRTPFPPGTKMAPGVSTPSSAASGAIFPPVTILCVQQSSGPRDPPHSSRQLEGTATEESPSSSRAVSTQQ
mmetsp:Transcript_22642/g.47754  ORF Transcript_22642/g.47754 Transcript_22642/m.47754 type:complete len:232 (+) Transcript_22642:290-985(+)